MALEGEFTSRGDRGLQNGVDKRFTEEGDLRVVQQPNAGAGSVMGDPFVTLFVGQTYAHNSGVFQVATTFVNHLGTWKTPISGYIFDQGVWKRIV